MSPSNTAPEIRRTSLGLRVTELEGLRALAALAVIVTHDGFMSGVTGRNILPGFVARMDLGVTVFFVLSGFLLYLPHARTHAGIGSAQHLRSYLARRAARLVPAALAVLVGAAILVPEARSAPGTAWVANLLQRQGWAPQWILPGLAQCWSLTTEIDFYLALPLLAWIAGRWVRPGREWTEPTVLGGYAVLAWVVRVVASGGHLPGAVAWGQVLPANLDWFAVGMAIAWVKVRPDSLARAHAVVRRSATSLLAAAALVLWVSTTHLAGPYDLTAPTTIQDLVKHLGYALIGLLVLAPTALGRDHPWHGALASAPMQFLGRISYGVFLWHLPVMFAVRRAIGLPLFGAGFWVTLALTLAATIPLATISWYALEKPVQVWVRGQTAREPDSLPVSADRA